MKYVDMPQISLTAVRVNAGMNQKQWAKCIGVDLLTISNWESGKTEPNVNQLRKMSKISKIPMDFIFIPEKS